MVFAVRRRPNLATLDGVVPAPNSPANHFLGCVLMTANFIRALAVKSLDIPDKKRCSDKAEFDLVTASTTIWATASPARWSFKRQTA